MTRRKTLMTYLIVYLFVIGTMLHYQSRAYNYPGQWSSSVELALVGLFAAFVQATGHSAPYYWENGEPPGDAQDHPVVNVTWHDALAYCDWLADERYSTRPGPGLRRG